MSVMIANNVAYLHTHILSDGEIIQHAHPFSKSENSNSGTQHQHSKLEVFMLSHLLLLALIMPVILSLIQLTHTPLQFHFSTGEIYTKSFSEIFLRGPPQRV